LQNIEQPLIIETLILIIYAYVYGFYLHLYIESLHAARTSSIIHQMAEWTISESESEEEEHQQEDEDLLNSVISRTSTEISADITSRDWKGKDM
jgi:hypothetical protein